MTHSGVLELSVSVHNPMLMSVGILSSYWHQLSFIRPRGRKAIIEFPNETLEAFLNLIQGLFPNKTGAWHAHNTTKALHGSGTFLHAGQWGNKLSSIPQ